MLKHAAFTHTGALLLCCDASISRTLSVLVHYGHWWSGWAQLLHTERSDLHHLQGHARACKGVLQHVQQLSCMLLLRGASPRLLKLLVAALNSCMRDHAPASQGWRLQPCALLLPLSPLP